MNTHIRAACSQTTCAQKIEHNWDYNQIILFRCFSNELGPDMRKLLCNEASEGQGHAGSGDQTGLNKATLKLPDYDRS